MFFVMESKVVVVEIREGFLEVVVVVVFGVVDVLNVFLGKDEG